MTEKKILFSFEQAGCSYMIHNPMIVFLLIGKKKCYSLLLHLKAIMNAAAQSMAISRLKGCCKKNQGIPIGQTRTWAIVIPLSYFIQSGSCNWSQISIYKSALSHFLLPPAGWEYLSFTIQVALPPVSVILISTLLFPVKMYIKSWIWKAFLFLVNDQRRHYVLGIWKSSCEYVQLFPISGDA